jgi:hypothetical protein
MHFDVFREGAIEPYARAEVIEEFLTGNTVRTNSTNFDSHLSGTTGRFGGGLAARVSQSVYIYGEYDYATGDHIQQPWSVDAGPEMAMVRPVILAPAVSPERRLNRHAKANRIYCLIWVSQRTSFTCGRYCSCLCVSVPFSRMPPPKQDKTNVPNHRSVFRF